MSWLLDLYHTYEANMAEVGKIEQKGTGEDYTLLPIAHTTQTAHVEVILDPKGDFVTARVIEKGAGNTVIPSTEDSANRAGKANAPYPLHDKLVYVAGDYEHYTGISKREEHGKYLAQLKSWADSPYTHPKVQAILVYVEKGTVIEDLVKEQVLHVNEKGQLIDKWDARLEEQHGSKPDIFKVVPAGQEGVFIRFTVYDPASEDFTKVWNDPQVYQSYVDFYQQRLGDVDLCYVTGELVPSTTKHSNKIRNSGDKAKLISANDSSGFTFRGRFDKATEAAVISYEVSQKAHNALKWLINKQGKRLEDRMFVFWNKESHRVPDPLQDTFEIAEIFGTQEERKGFTEDGYARLIHQAILGYRKLLPSKSPICILVLDSATTGRMSVQYYRTMDQDTYFHHIETWHKTCAWKHRYRKDHTNQTVTFFGAPASKDIAFAAYGPRASDKLTKGLMERLLPSVLDGRALPLDIVRAVVNRTSNPVGMATWEWEKTLSIACALVMRKRWETRKEEVVTMRVREDEASRDYLFGRLLAVADVLERSALGREENRATNAIRYMSAFSKHPKRTWGVIQSALLPYQARLGTKATRYTKLIDDIASRILLEDFSNKPLAEDYLLGFYSQRHELYQKKEPLQTEEEVV